MARTLSKSLASVVERLELERPQLVTLRDIEGICADEGVGTEPRVVASRLKKAGWFLPTNKRGVWEFAPAELAGPYSSCDPLLPVKAFVAASPGTEPLLRGQTAAWAMGLADRVPATAEVALAECPYRCIPEGVSACTYRTNIEPVQTRGTRSLAPEAIIVQMAERPSTVRSWASAVEWLPNVMAEMDADTTFAELGGRAAATIQRSGYLLQGARPDIAEEIFKHARLHSAARFGRGKPKRYDKKWKVTDAELPWNPAEIEEAS